VGIRFKSFVVVMALVGAGLVAAPAASAATTPSVKMTQPTFQSLTDEGCAGCGFTFPDAFDATFTLPWSVVAPAGVCSQTLTDSDYNDLGGDIDPILGGPSATFPVPKTARSYSGGDGFFYDFMRGGYSAYVTVKECNGVKVRSNPVHTVLKPGDNKDSAMVYSRGGGWKTANCTCFLGGTSTYTSTKNATISFLTAQPLDATGIRLALLMPTGPGRGSAALYVDGVWRATINTYHAVSNVNGKITYQLLIPGKSVHLVKIVNLATAGHPRIDLDATINGG
jgi:hypothetical protein